MAEKLKKKSVRKIYLSIYVILKTMYPPGYHHNGFAATHALGQMMYCYTLLLPMTSEFFDVFLSCISGW